MDAAPLFGLCAGPHSPSGQHALCPALRDIQRPGVSLHLVEFWGRPASMEYSSAPLALVDKKYEPALFPLPLAVSDSLDDELFGIRVAGGALVFRAGTAEYRLGSLRAIPLL